MRSAYFLLLSALCCFPILVHGQIDSTLESPDFQAIITGPSDIETGKIAVFDAENSIGLAADVQVRWYLNGSAQPISQGTQAAYTPLEPGETVIRLVLRRTVNEIIEEVQTEKTITAYNRKIVLVADNSIPQVKLDAHNKTAKENGIFLRILQPNTAGLTNASTIELLTSLIQNNVTAFQGAESIIVWVDGTAGMQSLLRASEMQPDLAEAIKGQTITLFTNRGLQTTARTVRGPFAVLDPLQVIVTRKEAINPLLAASTPEEFIANIEQNDIGYEVVDANAVRVLPWNLLSSLVSYMLTSGVPSQTIILLLALPVIATILAFSKQVIGISTLGLYTPSVIALGFITLGWKIGVPIILFIIATGYLTRSLMRKWRLLYIPKVAITITVVSFTILLLLGIGATFNMTLSEDKIFILLIMSTLSESFFNLKIEAGWRGAFLSVGETIGAALVAAFVVQLSFMESLFLAYPEFILLTLVINIFLGRWSGLRLIEYFRFREVFAHIQEE
jgi:hypothetical protein